ncbi:interleukin-2 receptor subunit beta isoform X2 [Tachysurus fulvidraco]|uniref:interleukin-2 receptor subunit beta isoform X2 n=1 Tax=Tachysurus fulvidraco TaxID=1234273 RepID=UPI001FEED2FA|nr:interleukin-2 receptor subunit beta isoform X2 [Tachysurus fulvidraco]
MWSVCLVLFLLLPGDSHSSLTHSDLSCVNDYMKKIWCVWNSTVWLAGQKCIVQVTRDTHRGTKIKNCSLDTTRSCVINMSIKFNFAENMMVDVFCNGTQMDSVKQYQPGRHVKLHPPDQLNVIRNNMTWSRGAQFPRLITQCVYEVQVKAKQQSWEEVKPRSVDGTFVLLDGVCEGDCESRVRVKPLEPEREDQIRGCWSDWSPAVSWRSEVTRSTRGPHKPEMTNTQMFNISHPAVIGGLVGIVALILILLIPLSVYRHKCGLKVDCEHVPDPSKYFQPLIKEHKGNFQEWLGPKHSTSLFLPPQSCDCEISPIDEVSDAWDDPLASNMLLAYPNHTAALHRQMSNSSELSSGVSNMGYFYSEYQPGSVCLDSCPVYFTYHPEAGVIQTSLSYERLHGTMPTSPDSGFGMETEKEEADEEEQEDKAGNGQKIECSGVNMQHLVSFIVSLPENTRTTNPPPSFTEFTPWQEEPESSGVIVNSEPLETAAIRPSSMVVQPCSSGYLTLKEMQKYSNKSI